MSDLYKSEMAAVYKSDMAAVILKLNNLGVAFKDSCEGLKSALAEIERGLFEGTPSPDVVLLGDRDYTLAGDQAWVTVKELSVRIKKTDEGVLVDIYPRGNEEADSISSAFAFDSEADVDEPMDEVDTTDYKEDLHKYGGF